MDESDEGDQRHLPARAWTEIRGVAADGVYAGLLTIPVAIGVAAYIFVWLSLLRHRVRRRAERQRADAAPTQ